MNAAKLEHRLSQIKTAITALNGIGPGRRRPGGYKLSAATEESS